MIEIFDEGSYRVIYRENPHALARERNLLLFSRLSRQIVEASGIEHFKRSGSGQPLSKPAEWTPAGASLKAVHQRAEGPQSATTTRTRIGRDAAARREAVREAG